MVQPRVVTVSVRRSDLLRVRITCRCGNQFVTEIPKQVATGVNLCVCSGVNAASQKPCGRMFTAQKIGDKWEIKPMEEGAVQDSSFKEV